MAVKFLEVVPYTKENIGGFEPQTWKLITPEPPSKNYDTRESLEDVRLFSTVKTLHIISIIYTAPRQRTLAPGSKICQTFFFPWL